MRKEIWIKVENLQQYTDNEQKIMKVLKKYNLENNNRIVVFDAKCRSIIERKALRKLRLPHVNRKYKEYHEQCLTPYPIMHIGIDSFQRTGYSEVERAVLGW